MEEKNKKSEAALREENILEFWRENKIFSKTLKQTEGRKEFVFFEGPPTANGKPGIHHLEARAFKDAIPRYKTMRGYHVRRKGGWDTHGLPVELQVEKKLGLNSKKAIEEYGIAKFNQECKESVWEYLDVWNKFTKRIGFWVDQENPYVTYHNDYIESVWNIVKKINEQNLLYKDYKVVPWCPRCGTALSSHELAQGYEDIKDLSVYVKFKLKHASLLQISSRFTRQNPPGGGATQKLEETRPCYILAWTTTPWTLPGNVALAVGEDVGYVKIKLGDEVYILAENRLSVIEGEYEIIGRLKGKDLLGLEYEPLYPFLQNVISEKEKPKMEKAYRVYGADFVTTEDGTGIVHTAVMYGQDDFVLGTEIGLPKHHLVGLDGKFLPGTGIFEGRFVKDEEVAVDVIKDLAHRGLLLKKEKYEHSYPHCWRCHTALIYYARDSWYIRVSDSKIKEKMIAENKGINWEPSHIRDGRFGEWLREIKDWAISRERYWGTPLPVWACESCRRVEVLGSIDEIKDKTKKSGNKYLIMRHGEAENNTLEIVSSDINNTHHLTEKGRGQVREFALSLRERKVDMIFVSPFLRTRETAEIVAEVLGMPLKDINYDVRLVELNDGIFDAKPSKEVNNFLIQNNLDRYSGASPDGESLVDVKKRVGEFLYEVEEKYQNKNILIITHEDVGYALISVASGLDKKATLEEIKNSFLNAEGRELKFVPISHNENYELDLHRPYIDELSLVCTRSTGSGQVCGGDLVRTKEVMDVWFDSGAMPFAQDHYPFEGKKWVDGAGYPADYISEAIDQTRGWFYTLHAIGVLMGRGKAYKNVICLGHLMDAVGKKMSKSVGNVVDPWEAMDKYGVDTLRLWMYSVNQPGESKNFDEKTVSLLHQQVFGLLYNVLAFYELYRDKSLENNNWPKFRMKPKNILDRWILDELDGLVSINTQYLDEYKLLEPTREIREFIGNLSTWYLRRSRERIKEGDEEAKGTLYFILKTLAKLLAPLAPFAAEDIWHKLKIENDEESVHLAKWPARSMRTGVGFPVESYMERVRKIVTLGLEARQKAGIKVRQPLAKLEVKDMNFETRRFLFWKDYVRPEDYLDLIKEEINVKEVVENKNIEGEGLLDIKISEELKQEGDYRELVRGLQEMRKNMGLTPNDVVALAFETSDAGRKLIEKFEGDLKKTVLVSGIEFGSNGGKEVRVDELSFRVDITRQ